MNRYTFHSHDATYRFDRGTITFWPRARFIAAPDGETGLQCVTNDDLFLAFADNSGCHLDSELSEAAQYAACIEKLGNLGYSVWSINGLWRQSVHHPIHK